MWYFISIIVSCLGMYLILAHKEKELRGEEPHHVVHKVRESSNRILSGIWRRTRAVSVHLIEAIAHYTVVAGRVVGRVCMLIGREIVRLCVHVWHGVRQATHAIADKVAHPHIRHHPRHARHEHHRP